MDEELERFDAGVHEETGKWLQLTQVRVRDMVERIRLRFEQEKTNLMAAVEERNAIIRFWMLMSLVSGRP